MRVRVTALVHWAVGAGGSTFSTFDPKTSTGGGKKAMKSPKSSASYPGSTLGSSAIYNPWSQVNHTLACLLCYIQVLELIVAGEEDGPFSLACGAARHSCGTC